MLQDFHFLRPLWFIALLPALLLCIGLLLRQRDQQQWLRYISPNLLPFLLDQVQQRQRRWPLVGLLALWAVAIFALAGPVWQKIPQPVERSNQALVICWDLSPSMLAEDIKPSRLVRSRLKLIDLLKARKDGQVALIAYSGEAYTVTPLTDDRGTIINLLPALNPASLPTVGSNPEMALSLALQLLADGGVRRGNILFLTDEIEPSALATIADELSHVPHQLTLWGVGTEQGAPIPLPEGGFAKNRQGEMVVARLNEDRLRQFATEQRAYYVPLVANNSDIETLLQLLSPIAPETSMADRTFDQWFEHGQYLALLLLPFVALLFRRGWIVGIFLLVSVPLSLTPQQAQAFEWRDLWLRQDQKAQKDLEAGDKEAAKRFSTPERRGAALYQQGEFAEAAEEFAQGKDAIAAYNRGNALTRNGEFDKAIAAYDEALRQRPDFAEAKDNREIARQLAELMKQQDQQGGDDNDSDGDKDQQQGDQDGSQQNGERKKGDSSESAQNGSQGQEEEMSEEQVRERAEQQQANQQEGEEENPYSQAAREQEEREQRTGELQAQDKEEGKPSDQQQAVVEAQAEPMTEEQQMLEQWLRKVPDDPGGLMRNKFKYQYMQRRQSLRDGYSNNQAEQRW
jgi:Ca-activated chloride channel family protein